MIIHQSEIRRENGQYIVFSRIEYDHDYNLPNELWFSVDEEVSNITTSRADIFLSTLIRVARAIGEDIEVRGDVSPQLLFGLREYLKVHAAWSGNPDIINLNAVNRIPAKRPTQEAAVSCNISGGIDSFHALWSQLPENEPSAALQVKYGIYGLGLSSPFRNDFLRQTYVPSLKNMMQSLGVKLLVVDSNVQLFSFPDPWLPISTTRIAIPQIFFTVDLNSFCAFIKYFYGTKTHGYKSPHRPSFFTRDITNIYSFGRHYKV